MYMICAGDFSSFIVHMPSMKTQYAVIAKVPVVYIKLRKESFHIAHVIREVIDR